MPRNIERCTPPISRASGELPEFFARYKVRDVAAVVRTETEIVDRPNILDFGAGIGSSVPYFRNEFRSAHLVCVDVSHKSLVIGRRRFPGLANFVQFDGQRLPFAEDRFDIGFVGCVFHHIDHAEHPAILGELGRVLKPRGHLFFFEHNPLNPLTARAVRTFAYGLNLATVLLLIEFLEINSYLAQALGIPPYACTFSS